MSRTDRAWALIFVMCLSLTPVSAVTPAAPQAGMAPDAAQQPSLGVNEIVRRLEENSKERSAALRGFQGTRVYHLEYRGILGDRDAEMTVKVNYAAPGEKEFVILSQTGSKFIKEHVFKGLLQGEKEAANEQNRELTALTAANYDFTLVGFDSSSETPHYVLKVVPKAHNKFIYRGKIWVDAKDFVVTHIEVEPASSPSFWVKRSEINLTYQKVDGFWLPSENQTKSWLRWGGRALLLIEYKGYKVTEAARLEHSGSE